MKRWGYWFHLLCQTSNHLMDRSMPTQNSGYEKTLEFTSSLLIFKQSSISFLWCQLLPKKTKLDQTGQTHSIQIPHRDHRMGKHKAREDATQLTNRIICLMLQAQHLIVVRSILSFLNNIELLQHYLYHSRITTLKKPRKDDMPTKHLECQRKT